MHKITKNNKKSDLSVWRPYILCHRFKAICNLHTYIELSVYNPYIGKIHCFSVCSGSNYQSDPIEYTSHCFGKIDFFTNYRVP